jgi:hypothetical protein
VLRERTPLGGCPGLSKDTRMNNFDCHSIHSNQDVDFDQLSTAIRNMKEWISSFKTKQGHIAISSFEISQQLVISLENLDELFAALFRENESRLSDVQKKYLTICERLLTACYCYINQFIELHRGEAVTNRNEHAKKLAHEFYYNAAYELRTPISALKAYSEPQILISMGVNSSPFVPENRDRLDKISYWIDELWKIVEDLPNLWKAHEQDPAT